MKPPGGPRGQFPNSTAAENWDRVDIRNFEKRSIDSRELELRWFAEDLVSDAKLFDLKLWIHSRWYADEQFHQILDAATDSGSTLTFAFLGRDLEHREDVIRRMIAEGHEVVPHGARHDRVYPGTRNESIGAEIGPVVDQLRAWGTPAEGVWLGGRSCLGRGELEALRRIGVRWCTGQVENAHDMPRGMRYVPDLKPHDYELLVSRAESLKFVVSVWHEMLSQADMGIFVSLPLALTMLSDDVLAAWSQLLSSAGGAVPVGQFPDPRGRPSIILDGSLHLHLV